VSLVRTGDPVEAAELIASGARLQRYAHDMQVAVRSMTSPGPWLHPRLPSPLRVTAVDRPADDIARASHGAYPAGHVDAAQAASLAEAVALYERIIAGQTAGPLIRAVSALLVDGLTETVAGALLVTAMPAAAWWDGGPWLCDLFVVPTHQGAGIGRQLLQLMIARCAERGYERIGLSVTDGNPAERLYRTLGFARCRSVFVIEKAG
jgi:GNAT superfamily N-acetyltransferase